jgi:hypothetical protein
MAAYKMAAVKFTPPNDFPLCLRRSHMIVIHLFLMLCDLQRVVRDLCPTLYIIAVGKFSLIGYLIVCSLAYDYFHKDCY